VKCAEALDELCDSHETFLLARSTDSRVGLSLVEPRRGARLDAQLVQQVAGTDHDCLLSTGSRGQSLAAIALRRLGLDPYPDTEDAVGAVKRSVLRWRFIDGIAAKLDGAELRAFGSQSGWGGAS
jgi:hypothetical protein